MEFLHSSLKRHFAENQLRRRKMLAVSQVSRALLWSERVEVKKTNSNLTQASRITVSLDVCNFKTATDEHVGDMKIDVLYFFLAYKDLENKIQSIQHLTSFYTP